MQERRTATMWNNEWFCPCPCHVIYWFIYLLSCRCCCRIMFDISFFFRLCACSSSFPFPEFLTFRDECSCSLLRSCSLDLLTWTIPLHLRLLPPYLDKDERRDEGLLHHLLLSYMHSHQTSQTNQVYEGLSNLKRLEGTGMRCKKKKKQFINLTEW